MVIVGRKILNNEVKNEEAIRAAAAAARELEENKSRCFNLSKIKPAAAKKDTDHHGNNNNRTTQSLEIQSTEILDATIEGFSLTTIIDATRNFNAKRKIGAGGFGQVYKGVLRNGKVIAVKRLSGQGRDEFLFEVKTISTVKHPNIIRLLGYCSEREELILVYEYMEKNSASCALFGSQKKNREVLNWETRLKICLGIAKGLAFLNEEHNIFHRDIKLSNVLLDQHLIPKICDFGLARRFEKEEGKESMEYLTRRVVGTYGYMAPEYLLGTVIEKIDVYSFGIVILELVSGKKNMIYGETHEQLLFLACALHKEGDLLAMVDADLHMNISVNEANMMLDLAMRCTNRSPKVRPTMSEVVSILEGESTVRTPPFYEPSAPINDVPNESMIMTMPISTNYSSSNNTSVEAIEGNFIDKDDVPQLLADSDDAYDLDDRGADQVVSSPPRSRKERSDTQIAFEGAFISEVIKDCINDAVKDIKLLIHSKLMTSLEPSTSSIAKPGNPTIFVDAIEIEEKHKLEYVQTSFEEGKFHIECSDEEFEAECNRWKDSLVGFFVNEPLPFNVDKQTVEKLWELKGEVSVLSMENGYFLFQFNCNEDKIMVLESSPWHIDEQPLVIREWDWKLKLDNTEMITLPVWVKIYNLPLFLWSSSFLSKVGSCLGIPLYSDRKTDNKQRLSFARLCVEIDAHKELPESLNISVKGVDYKLNLKYEWKPLRCATCCTFGHTEAKCGLNPEQK